MAERLEEVIEEDVRLPFLIAPDVGLRPCDEGCQFFGAGITHGIDFAILPDTDLPGK